MSEMENKFVYQLDKDGNEVCLNRDNLLHRTDGLPAKVTKEGEKIWMVNGDKHRVNAPAHDRPGVGHSFWRRGMLDNELGPAVVFYKDNHKEHWIKNKRHNAFGPAVKSDIIEQYWLNNVRYPRWVWKIIMLFRNYFKKST